jgi:hypothetical protein
MTYTGDSFVPIGGFIKVDFPTDVRYTKEVTLLTGNCSVNTCKAVSATSIQIQTTA